MYTEKTSRISVLKNLLSKMVITGFGQTKGYITIEPLTSMEISQLLKICRKIGISKSKLFHADYANVSFMKFSKKGNVPLLKEKFIIKCYIYLKKLLEQGNKSKKFLVLGHTIHKEI